MRAKYIIRTHVPNLLAATVLLAAGPGARAADVTQYVSDLASASMSNGWGPAEKDMSNGEQAAGDGRTITLNGKRYSKGIGVHAGSDIRYNLNGACSSFTATVGVDDEVTSAGSVVFQVYGDGVQLYQSGILTGQSASVPVSVNISGRNQLRLVVTDGGNGSAFDHADWADAQITCSSTAAASSNTGNLSGMTWASATNGWGPVERNSSNGESGTGDGRTITLNGVTYPTGLGVHAGSDIRYNLNGACTAFSAVVGVDDEVASRGSVVFEVWTDGIRRYQSPVMTGAAGGTRVSLDLAGALQLRLVVTDGGDGNAFDHGDWANATISCAADTIAPTVTSTTPAGSSVSATAKIGATFSEAVAGGTISSSSFTLVKQGSSTPLAASVTYDANTFTATLTPSTSLQTNASYTATVRGGSAGVTDLAGNALTTDKTWSFSTASITTSQPLVISGQSNVVISGVKISNPNGHCIEIRGNSQNITVQNSEIGPCSAAGISVSSSSNVTINSVYIHDTTDNGVTAISVSGLNLTKNRMERIKSGLYALSSTRVVVEGNNFLNVRGPIPRGQFVQFDKVYGGGNRIQCNVGENIMGQSYPEDAINMYQSNGLANDPIQVIGNKIRGGGPSGSGGGILLGDAGGSYQIARDNILVDPGQYGMAVSGGANISILNNQIYARQQSFTNVGIYVWNQSSSPCSNITVQGNSVNWTNSAGQPNPSWSPGNCGTVTGWSSNNWNAAISAAIWDQPIAACQ